MVRFEKISLLTKTLCDIIFRTLNPRGTLWTKDENKIGQKLLEKFGWKSGEGLGKTSQGMKDPIALNANFNQKGLGHEGKDDDVWLAHKDNFDDVLASLNRYEFTY